MGYDLQSMFQLIMKRPTPRSAILKPGYNNTWESDKSILPCYISI